MGIVRDGFVMFKNWADTINALPEEMQLECYKAVAEYGFTGEIPQGLSAVANAVLISFSGGMKTNMARYLASVENGKKGGRPKKSENREENDKPSETKENLEKPNTNLDKPSETIKEKDKRISINKKKVVDTTKEKENLTTSSTTLNSLLSCFENITLDVDFEDNAYDIDKLIEKVKESSYLQSFNTLSAVLSKYDEIMQDRYKDFVVKKNNNKKPIAREYKHENLYDDISSIQI